MAVVVVFGAVTAGLADYKHYWSTIDRPASELNREVAAAEFEHLMMQRPERKRLLTGLLRANGVALDGSDQALQALDDWLQHNVQGDDEGNPVSPWASVATDVGLYVGDVIIDRHPHLKWRLCTTTPNDLGYHRAVISGFRNVTNKRYHVDALRVVMVHVVRLAANLKVGDEQLRGMVARCGEIA